MKHSAPDTLLKHLLPFHTDVHHWELKHHMFRNIFKKGYEKRSFQIARGTLPHVITPLIVSSKVVHMLSKSTRRGFRDIFPILFTLQKIP